ncbi:putative death-receptor fusion protein-domain-containing protein [Podospora didyma]|uniref:Death-receptor fusion protein-domain-containing protein n=1 Tax=Podospora didyma TaxID=330526 RepID=A0AAE0N8T4_9PEZI|nr:putative death-receptor fusion protein-domain-containing protein [Podospora didyma]
METALIPQQHPTSTGGADALLFGVDSTVLANANTITQWLLKQPENSRPRLAQGLFDTLLEDASQSRQHHADGNACVKLCSFVQQCAKSADEALKQWAFAEDLSKRLFHFYLEWYEHDPHRALRLTLDVLVMSCSINPWPENGRAIKDHIVDTLVAIAARRSSRQLTKSGLQCLDYLLNKRAISIDDVARIYRETQPSAAGLSDLLLWKSFVFHLFSWMELPYVCPLAGKCIVHILQLESLPLSKDGLGPMFGPELWQSWFQETCIKNSSMIEHIRNYVLVPIFKGNKTVALGLLDAFNKGEPMKAVKNELADQSLLLQLATLELGKRYGLVEEPSNDNDISQSSITHIALRESVLDSLLAHPSPSVRSSAFSLLISSQATTKSFSAVAFSLIKRHLATFHADYDAKFRNEVLGLTKSLFKRVKNVISVVQRSLVNLANQGDQRPAGEAVRPAPKRKLGPEAALKDYDEAKEILDRHEAFLSWYLGFLKGELLPTSSYQRHITAARAALLLLKIGKHAGAADDGIDMDMANMVSSDFTWIRLLLDLIMDPFDDVREAASILLGLLPPETTGASTGSTEGPAILIEVLQEFCLRAQALADRTGRADHGDGAARSQGLLCTWLNKPESQISFALNIIQSLEGKISKAEHDLGHAAIENPVHADFAALSYVWQVLVRATYPDHQLQVLARIHRRIVDCAKRIWLAVKHVLCDDSPEGHLPEELEDIEGLDTKDLLSYSFRAVHESSNLLRLVLGTLRLGSVPGVPFPAPDVFKDGGYLTFEQLASLRHRGAFSTVSLTFSTCCQLTRNLFNAFPDADRSDNLLRAWYKGTLDCIMTQASTTRRSAGIPSLIAAILSANAESPSFAEVFNTLGDIGKKTVRLSETDGSNLPQVHALNCLREIFRSALLSKKAENFLGETLQLAADSLKSEVWAIRNCGLLLIRSLIDCLLGTGESKAIIESGWDGHSIRISYQKYPTLPGVILSLLQSADGVLDQPSHSAAAEAVFPALDIIRRAGPPEEYRDELRSHIESYLGSRIWHVREIAAKTLCSFMVQEDWVPEIQKLLVQSKGHANRVHGTLLAARFIIERKIDLGHDISPDSIPVRLLLEPLTHDVGPFNNCPEIRAASLEILNLLTSFISDGPSLHLPVDANLTPSKHSFPSSALLDMQVAFKVVYDTAVSGDINTLRTAVLQMLITDTNTACRMLEEIPVAWGGVVSARREFCVLYTDICNSPTVPEVRAQALTNLGSLMISILSQGAQVELPGPEHIDRLWAHLLNAEINPTLSCAIIDTSGTLMAALISYNVDNIANMDQRLRSWGELIADSLAVENTFDTRYAAVMALKSFFVGSKHHSWDARYLPALSALYDGLIDDDDDVREVAASAASGVIGSHMVAPTAADRLVVWLRQQFGELEEFRSLLTCRIAGQASALKGVQLHSAHEQLVEAMDFDDSLFAAEDHNLFIDEVRETSRWCQALHDIKQFKGDSSLQDLKEWTESGLARLIQLAEKEDGPLGWASDQHVFAICVRILLSATAIVCAGEPSTVGNLLEQFRDIGSKARIHGSLTEMAMPEVPI